MASVINFDKLKIYYFFFFFYFLSSWMNSTPSFCNKKISRLLVISRGWRGGQTQCGELSARGLRAKPPRAPPFVCGRHLFGQPSGPLRTSTLFFLPALSQGLGERLSIMLSLVTFYFFFLVLFCFPLSSTKAKYKIISTYF